MKCMNCIEEIPPSWVAALKTNVCPACGGQIYNDNVAELIEGLAASFSEMEFNPQGIAGWLLSNYEMKKIGEAKPITFYGSIKTTPAVRKPENIEDNNTPIQRSKFMKNAGISDKHLDESLKASKAAQARKLLEDHNLINNVVDDDLAEDEFDEGDDFEINVNEEDKFLQSLHPHADTNAEDYINKERLKKLQRQEIISSGGKIGKIRRIE